MAYVSSADQKLLAVRYQFTTRLALLFGLSVVIYMLIGRLVPLGAARAVSIEMYEGFRYAALSITAASVLGAMMLRRVLLARRQMEMAARRGTGAVLGRLSLNTIICAALGEMLGILGMVSSLLTGETDFSWRLGVAGLLLIAYSYPRRWEWQRQVATAQAASGGETVPHERIFT
jgi:hypothetical protein